MGWVMKKLKGKLLELFKEIEHGDQEHRDWLYDKMVEFQNKDVNSLTSCEHKNVRENLDGGRFDECKDCGKRWG